MHTPEFQRLHTAQVEAFNELHGARQHAHACYEHLGPAGQRASQAHIEQQAAVEAAASLALNTYMESRRAFDAAAYEQQFRTTGRLQAAA